MTLMELDRPIDLGVTIADAEVGIEADWSVPLHAKGAIIIANGTGNARLSRHNREIGRSIYDAGYATLLLDLLTLEEEREDTLTGSFQLNIDLLAARLTAAGRWVTESGIPDLPLGYLCSGVASAAAVVAAVREPGAVSAIVSRGGRPDLAGIELHKLATPTLLIVGSSDGRVFELNRWALRRFKGEGRIAVVPGASHLFEEPGTSNRMCSLAVQWFDRHMSSGPRRFYPNLIKATV